MATNEETDAPRTRILSVRVDEEIYNRIKTEAADLDIPVSRFVYNLLEASWKDYETMRKTGLLWMFKRLRKVIRKI